MFSCCSGLCFAGESGVDARTHETLPRSVEILHRTRVVFTPDTPLKQLLAPIDLFPFCFRHYMSWPLFFNYDIDFQRLMEALHIVAQKCTLLCGRLSTDSQGRYFIEVRVLVFDDISVFFVKVGSTKEKKYDFPVVEMKAKMQMAEGILGHGQITTDSADFPVHPDNLPFYLEPLDINVIHKYAILQSASHLWSHCRGQDPLLSVKLTHFSDGCCLVISVGHFVVDGMRLSELYRDISRAYCGKEVPMRDINRQCMTIEEFSQHFSPEDKQDCTIPETPSTGREPVALKQYPKESSSFEMLYLANEVINDMKSRVAQFIPKGSFVSTADLIQALLWMLGCELYEDCGEVTNSTDLGVVNTISVYSAELCLNGLGIIPPNYFGNGVLVPGIYAGNEMGSKSLIELLASLALLTRQRQTELKEQSKEVFKELPISEVNFGQGAPSLFLCIALLPLIGSGWFVTPVSHTGGCLVTLLATTKQKERLKKSCVLKECAPGVRSLFEDLGVADLNQLMKHKQG